MKRIIFSVTFGLYLFAMFATQAFSATSINPSLTLNPNAVIQGEPVMVTFKNLKISEIKSVTYDKKTLSVFLYKNNPTAFIGVDILKKPGTYEIAATTTNGKILKSFLTVTARPKIEAPMAVPEKLGGNSAANQTKVVTQMTKENKDLAEIFTGAKSFWTEKFRWPVAIPIITDSYGYTRQTGAYNISHKGTDLRAKTGTKVMAMNRGVVRIATNYQTYGKTVVIDHGLGISTIYMHMSKINVNVGELVKPGQTIGLSGQTGYAEAPHLHLSIKIDKISIDPEKFIKLFE